LAYTLQGAMPRVNASGGPRGRRDWADIVALYEALAQLRHRRLWS